MPPACGFNATIETFGRIEAELVRRQTDILTFPPNARVNRLEIAKRLRTEVLEPWRAAAGRCCKAPPSAGWFASPRACRRRFANTCMPAKDPSSCGRWHSKAATPPMRRAPLQAEQQLGKTLNLVNVLASAK